MAKRTAVLMPQTLDILETMGAQIKRARLRRKISADLVAERAGVSRATLWSVEKGSPSVSIGMYAAVLHALHGMDKDLLLIAKGRENENGKVYLRLCRLAGKGPCANGHAFCRK